MTNFLISDAWAQAGGGGSSMFSLLPLVLIFVLFYFLLIRPQQKRKKEHKNLLTAMKIGDEVATNGGLLGKVADLDDNFVTLDVAQGASIKSVNVQVQRHAIAQMVPKGTFKELDPVGKQSKGSRKRSKGSANNLSAQTAEAQSDNLNEDATFEDSDKKDATLEIQELEDVKKNTEEETDKLPVKEDANALGQGEDDPLWKQWVRNLFRRT